MAIPPAGLGFDNVLCSLEAHARGARALAESDQLVRLAFRQERCGVFAEAVREFIADRGDEEPTEPDTGEIFDLFDELSFPIDL